MYGPMNAPKNVQFPVFPSDRKRAEGSLEFNKIITTV